MSENAAGNGATGINTRELQELVQSLKETILELRETVDEIYNPMRKKPVEIVQEARTSESSQDKDDDVSNSTASSRPGNALPERQVRGQEHSSQVSEHAACSGNGSPERNGNTRPVTPAVGSGPGYSVSGKNGDIPAPTAFHGMGALVGALRNGRMDLSRLAGLLRLLYDLQTKVPPEYLSGLADILYDSGLVDERQRDTLKRLIDLARVGREHGLSIDESIAILAALARELGLDITQVTDQLVRAILEAKGGAAVWEPQQQ